MKLGSHATEDAPNRIAALVAAFNHGDQSLYLRGRLDTARFLRQRDTMNTAQVEQEQAAQRLVAAVRDLARAGGVGETVRVVNEGLAPFLPPLELHRERGRYRCEDAPVLAAKLGFAPAVVREVAEVFVQPQTQTATAFDADGHIMEVVKW